MENQRLRHCRHFFLQMNKLRKNCTHPHADLCRKGKTHPLTDIYDCVLAHVIAHVECTSIYMANI